MRWATRLSRSKPKKKGAQFGGLMGESVQAILDGRAGSQHGRARLKGFLEGDAKAEEVLTDLFWSLLNSKEFIFNH